MLVVRKLGSELPFFFRLRRLLCTVGFAKREARIVPWRSPQMTDGANCRACTCECLLRKKLLPMAANTSIVIGKIRDVRKRSLRIPFCRNFVTRVAAQTFVLFG